MTLVYRVLFVCTGNIFRSVSAEYALRRVALNVPQLEIASAGTIASPMDFFPTVLTTLAARGIDPKNHLQRKLTKDIISWANLVIAMGEDHRTFIDQEFGIAAPLYLELAGHGELPILDLHEALPNYREVPQRADEYVSQIVNQIVDLAPLVKESILRRL